MNLFPSGDAAARPLAPGESLGRFGRFEARLAVDAWEIEAAQALRARSFFANGGPSHDADRFDHHADHLLLLDTEEDGPLADRIAGTTRLITGGAAQGAHHFYSGGEFDLDPLLRRNRDLRFLEVGRSCVRPDLRARGGAADALWGGIWAYAGRSGAAAMIGCASLTRAVPAAHAPTLSFLAQRHLARGGWAVRALPDRFCEMDLMPAEAVDPRAARLALPPLLRGYLRLGAMVGDGCVADEDFGTTDVFIVLPVGAIGGRYVAQYSSAAPRAA